MRGEEKTGCMGELEAGGRRAKCRLLSPGVQALVRGAGPCPGCLQRCREHYAAHRASRCERASAQTCAGRLVLRQGSARGRHLPTLPSPPRSPRFHLPKKEGKRGGHGHPTEPRAAHQQRPGEPHVAAGAVPPAAGVASAASTATRAPAQHRPLPSRRRLSPRWKGRPLGPTGFISSATSLSVQQ